MSTPSEPNVVADRRWLIGIGISVAFGLFGVIMALLNYADRDKPQAPGAAPATAAAPTAGPAPKAHGKGRGKD
jgi:hypothetical protein